jgi:arylsulfatase
MSYDLPWANASNSPFRLFKRWTHEGGISTPLSWLDKIKKPAIIHDPTHIIDIAAICIDVAGAAYPHELNGKSITPMEGESFLSVVDESRWNRQNPIFWEHEGSRAVRAGQWKLVSEVGGQWELYDMDEDRTELDDLAETNRPKAEELARLYDVWAERNGVMRWPILPWNPSMRSSHNHKV